MAVPGRPQQGFPSTEKQAMDLNIVVNIFDPHRTPTAIIDRQSDGIMIDVEGILIETTDSVETIFRTYRGFQLKGRVTLMMPSQVFGNPEFLDRGCQYIDREFVQLNNVHEKIFRMLLFIYFFIFIGCLTLIL
ncbi:hypothetical protein BGX34_009629 [Mortierella sp. NVP85]|nr:hypothetical protein BGX34_009629 [Mortierella sp. NVP85]